MNQAIQPFLTADEDEAIREKGIVIIGHIRAREAYDRHKATLYNRNAPPPPIREFQKPVIDFEATSYVTMTPLKTFKVKYDTFDAPKMYKINAFSLTRWVFIKSNVT